MSTLSWVYGRRLWRLLTTRSVGLSSGGLDQGGAEGGAGFGLVVGAAGLRGRDLGGRRLAKDVGAEGWGEPDVGFVAGAGLGLRHFEAAILSGGATVFKPLAAVLIPEHVRCGLDAHATLTASAAPRSVYDREL